MKCPTINGECLGEECVRWDKKHGKCYEVVRMELETLAYEKTTDLMSFYNVMWRISVGQLLRDPTIPQDVKDALQSAQNASEVEKLLRDAGII
jgi:hypothetical protein